MDDIIMNHSNTEITFVDRMLKEEMKIQQSKPTIDNTSSSRNGGGGGSTSAIPPHKYRFQQLKSYNSNTSTPTQTHTSKQNTHKISSSSGTSMKPTEFLVEDKTPPQEQQQRQVKTRSIWCGGPFFCNPRKNKNYAKEPTTTTTNNEQKSSIVNDDSSNTLIDAIHAISLQHDKSLLKDDNNKNLLLDTIHTKDSEINILREKLTALNDENIKLIDDYNKLTIVSIEKEKTMKDQMEQHHLIEVNALETQINVANESINTYTSDIKQQQQTIGDIEEKLKMTTITEDLLMIKKRKNDEKMKTLKAKHEQEIDALEHNIEVLQSTIDEQTSTYSSSLQKMNSLFDSCTNYNNESIELHGDLEYTLNMIESFLSSYQQENESLKKQSTEHRQLIDNLKDELKEKSTVINETKNLIDALALEKLESYYSIWIMSFQEKLNKLKLDQTNNNKGEEGIKNVVDGIIDDINTNNDEATTKDKVSLTIVSRSTNEDSEEKGSFELESVSVEKVSKSSSQADY